MTSDRTVTSGFVVWPLCQFVEDYGVDDPDISLPALYELTRRFSAEFAIRAFRGANAFTFWSRTQRLSCRSWKNSATPYEA